MGRIENLIKKARNKSFFNGRPIRHWEEKAKELVIRQLVNASNLDKRSMIGYIASQRLLELAKQEDPEVFDKLLKERSRSRRNIGKILSRI